MYACISSNSEKQTQAKIKTKAAFMPLRYVWKKLVIMLGLVKMCQWSERNIFVSGI